MIYVCDAIMGTGKSSAAITYMNEHKDEKFVYITPYLEEAARIKDGCPDLHFVEPSDKIEEYNFKKRDHTAALISKGKNIATTHQAFKNYTSEMLEDIERHGYRLIIDENLDVLKQYDCREEDVDIAIMAGYIEDNDGVYTLVKEGYSGKLFAQMFDFLSNRELIRLEAGASGGGNEKLFYWVLPPSLVKSFKDVLILTYLFEGQGLHHFLEMYDLEYEYIGIEKRDDGTFSFGDAPGYVPEYVPRLGEMIHIIDKPRLNAVGDDYYALSMSWFASNPDGVEQLKANVYNCVNNIWRDADASEKMCGAFNKYAGKLKGKGYTKAFTSFNARATNAYRNRLYLSYVVNVFMNVGEKRFYHKYGIDVDEDKYALSVMVQWIWRSAIRDGSEIYLYIPSSRMRGLLQDWIQTTSEGGENAI